MREIERERQFEGICIDYHCEALCFVYMHVANSHELLLGR